MVEKTIQIENISLTEFLGVQNKNIKVVATAFPTSKIISRGNAIHIKGNPADVIKINQVILKLIDHFNEFGMLSADTVKHYLNEGELAPRMPSSEEVLIYGTQGNLIKAKTINQQKLVNLCKENDLVFALGPAGTGKTYISVALAVKALKNKEVKKIIITRPAVEAGENLGFLPGDLREKIDPYLRPVYDALDDMVPAEKLKYYEENRIIEIAPLAYMRGRTLNNAFILLDEAQNTTPMQIKMFLTRMGPNSKVVVNGDTTQIDLPKNQKSGLIEAIEILQDVKDIGFIQFRGHDVIRHRIVKDIISAYDKYQGEKS
ncbi:MAG: PhoH family protein [Bacteroidetes bacterium]|nr:PhoH family protein [Bacteroidota bacterium]